MHSNPRHRPSRRDLLASAAGLPLIAGRSLGIRPRARGAGGRRPPNLLVLIADDTSRINIGAYGNASSTTPNLDRFIAEGMRFNRAYTPVALCTPARASLYTGLYPSAHGATGFDPIRKRVATAPQLLGKAGVATGLIGKVHVEPQAQFPFEFLATGDAFLKRRSAESFVEAFEQFTDTAPERPFACFVNFKDPHRPFGHKKSESDGGAPRLHDPDDIELFAFLWDTPLARADMARYYDALKRMDDTVGLLLNSLAASGRDRDTLVIFTSDNGMPFPFAKATLYEAGINLPFAARWPGVIEPGSANDSPVGLVDVLPTALDLFGAETGSELHGQSLLPLLRGEAAAVRDTWFAMHTSQKIGATYPSRSLRKGDLKYICNLRPQVQFSITGFKRSPTWQSWQQLLEREDIPELEARMYGLVRRPPEELFDLERDPFELENLAQATERAADLESMRSGLVEHMRRFDDHNGLVELEAVRSGKGPAPKPPSGGAGPQEEPRRR